MSSAWIWFIATRVLVLSLMVPCGVIGNVTVLIIYGREKKQSAGGGAVYIKALAVIDVLSCVLLLPQLPLLELGQVNDNHTLGIWTIVTAQLITKQLSYICMQVTMALDQFVAVFYPFKHTKLRKIINKTMLSTGIILVVLVPSVRYGLSRVVPQYWHTILYRAVFLSIFIPALLALLVAYPAVALKLHHQKKQTTRVIKPQATTTAPPAAVAVTNQANTAATAQPPPPSPPTTTTQTTDGSNKRRATHVQALKIYTTIFLWFVITNSAINFVVSNDIVWLLYVCFVNHTINPVIYYCFVEKFRQSVKENWRRLIGR